MGEETAKLKPAGEVEMKGATVRSVIVTALALAMATLVITGCWKNGLWTALTPLDSSKDSVGYSFSLLASQVVKCNARCRGENAVSCPQRAISHFIEKNKHCPPFLASPLLTTSVSHRPFMQKVKRKVTSSPHKAFALSVLLALNPAGRRGESPASNGTALNSARWCRPPP